MSTISPLSKYTKISPQHSARKHAIDTITIHCFVGEVRAFNGVEYFSSTEAAVRRCSANYVVGVDGSIGCAVPEDLRSWCSSDQQNDDRAVTIEVASKTYEPYKVSDAAYRSLIVLVADICKRNGIKKLVWSDNKDDRVNHRNGCNMTVHRDYAAKACPGEYLYSRMATIADEVNKIITDSKETAWSQLAKDWAVKNGLISGYGNGYYGWSDNLTREQMAVVLYRLWIMMGGRKE